MHEARLVHGFQRSEHVQTNLAHILAAHGSTDEEIQVAVDQGLHDDGKFLAASNEAVQQGEFGIVVSDDTNDVIL